MVNRMPNRSLLTAAIVVWAVAVLVAVFLGLPMLLTEMGVPRAQVVKKGGAKKPPVLPRREGP